MNTKESNKWLNMVKQILIKPNGKLRIALDVDDVLYECAKFAAGLANEKYGLRIGMQDIISWGKTGRPTDAIFEFFKLEDFYENQPIIKGAQEFVKALLARGFEVLFITAVAPEMAGIRIKRLMKDFPEVKPENIIITSRKDICEVDVLLDDAPHNYFDAAAEYPVLFRRPWNEHITGGLAVNGYEEFLTLVDNIDKRKNGTASIKQTNSVVCLVGPSGSGKTAIAEQMSSTGNYAIPKSCTTRAKRKGEADGAYRFISKEQFEQMKADGLFIETTVYAGNYYGMCREEVDNILNNGKNAILPIDICGATAMKTFYGDKAISVFIDRNKAEVIKSIIERDVPDEDKYKRIVSLNDEYKNSNICDIVIQNQGTIDDVCQALKASIE